MKFAFLLLVFLAVALLLGGVWWLLKRFALILVAVLAMSLAFAFTIGPWISALLLVLMLCFWWGQRRRAGRSLPGAQQPPPRKWSKVTACALLLAASAGLIVAEGPSTAVTAPANESGEGVLGHVVKRTLIGQVVSFLRRAGERRKSRATAPWPLGAAQAGSWRGPVAPRPP